MCISVYPYKKGFAEKEGRLKNTFSMDQKKYFTKPY